MKILLIEDDYPIASLIRLGLKGAHYTVDIAEDGPTGLQMALEGGYALIILDVMLPGQDGWSICGTLRERRNTTPILMLTARDSPEDRVRGLELGADDYLAKPFHFPEFLARVQALLRRNEVQKARVIRVADLEIDTTLGRASRAGRSVPLSRREHVLLEALAAREGEALSLEHLGARLQEHDEETGADLPAEIEALRRKIDGPSDTALISTVDGVGYLLRAPEATRLAYAAA